MSEGAWVEYFAYGSNLSSRQMRQRCPTARVASRAVLPGHRLEFVQPHDAWGGGVAGILPDPGRRVEGVVYRLSAEDLHRLDAYEPVRERRYWRTRVQVTLPAGTMKLAWTYEGLVLDGAPFAPSERYLATLIDGAREHGLPEDYIAWLASPDRAGMRSTD